MSSTNSGSISKRKRVRNWFHDKLGRSSSQPPPSPPAHPSPHQATSPLVLPNPGGLTTDISDTQRALSTDHQVLATQPTLTLRATGDQLPNPEPGPPAGDSSTTTEQIDPANEAEASHSTTVSPEVSPIPSTPAPAAPTDDGSKAPGPRGTTKAGSPIWTGLRASLKMLAETEGVFGPISAAARVLLGCCDTFETAAKNQQDYEDLATELTGLSQSIAQHFKANISSPMTGCISGIVKMIEEETAEIEGRTERGTGRRLLTAKMDEDELMRRHRRIQSLFRQLQTNLGASTWSIANEILINTRLEMLKSVDLADYDSSLATSISRRTCTEGTRTKVLEELNKWANDADGPGVYWMNGMAGTGKTTIACTFSGLLKRRGLLAASFFCTRTSQECRDVTRIIPTIACQLARYSPPFQHHLCDAIAEEPTARSKTIEKQFELLLTGPLLKMGDATLKSQVVVIDALDECDDQGGVGMLLDVLFKLTSRLPLKIFVTSRPESGIYSKMTDHAGSRTGVHLHDIEKSLVRADIKLYLEEVLGPVSPDPSQIEELVERCGVLFIYAATLARYILPGGGKINSQNRLRRVLDMSPDAVKGTEQIDTLYAAVLKSALADEDMEEEEKEDVWTVLRMVLLAEEPIGVETIATLGGIGDGSRVEYALVPLRSVLHQSSTGVVSTLHASFPDFMFSPKRSGPYFCDTAKYSPSLADKCFKIMKTQLRMNICDLPSSFIPDAKVEDLQDRIKANISPTLGYACRYWASHLRKAPRSGKLMTALEEFVTVQILFWMEIMSLRRDLPTGVEMLSSSTQWLTQPGAGTSEQALAVMVADAANFVTLHASTPASESTPHIYISSLPFCARSSSVYTRYWPRMRGLLYLRGSLMDRRETAALATWNIGSEVLSVAYSPDGSRVAVGCLDGSVSIRNAYDGTLLVGPLQGHTDAVRSVVFSGDGRLVASGSADCTIRVWDVRSGSLITDPFHGHTDRVNSVSFSPDSTRIASGSSDSTIRVWRATDGALLMDPLQVHTGAIKCVTFSSDGTLIASASSDKTIRLWHSHDGTPAASPLLGHTDGVNCVTFTPDGTRLVSGSHDYTVRVWRVSDGSAVTGPFQGHTDRVTSVAVSGDGRLVASGSRDCTVRVWRLDDGTLAAGPFAGHTDWINSVVYAPDGTRVISGSDDGTMRVWNVRGGLVATASSDLPLSELKWLCFSPDGAHVVTESYDNGIQMWRVTDGTCQPGSVDMRPPSPRLEMSSPDGLYTAQTDEDGDLVQVPPSMDSQ
ncbi:Vegetative incompatibility protein HET-E-1 [Rhizoctonia solani AG-1 IB]|uniref:Vegetative incompatibility protein HET-E-1 n=1 Tax=Thanatephorus cucumeris (strain AG1-IB / isolate 7/3/14) TaxID=1108050 RepID=M5C7G3_THACB|nr:Vegetative incompatibility protein HET-E-1 [Rhizoctonia solani AG-1 IB]